MEIKCNKRETSVLAKNSADRLFQRVEGKIKTPTDKCSLSIGVYRCGGGKGI